MVSPFVPAKALAHAKLTQGKMKYSVRNRPEPKRLSMHLPRRQFLRLAAGTAVLPAIPRLARAQSYPARPVRWIVGFAAGGPQDIVARLLAQYLSERLSQQFVIENRTGAGGNIGTETVVRAPADGYTILMIGASATINPTLYDNLSFV